MCIHEHIIYIIESQRVVQSFFSELFYETAEPDLQWFRVTQETGSTL